MTYFKKALMGSAVGAAVLVSAAAPANAQTYRDYDRDRDRGGVSAGEVIAGVAILGGLAAVIAAASDDDDRYDDRYDDGYYRGTNGYPTNGYNRGSARYNNGQRAIQQCVQAARYEASRYGNAQITQVTDVDRVRRGVRVRGDLVVNEGRNNRYRGRGYNNNYDRGSFTCTIRRGRVVDVDINGI